MYIRKIRNPRSNIIKWWLIAGMVIFIALWVNFFSRDTQTSTQDVSLTTWQSSQPSSPWEIGNTIVIQGTIQRNSSVTSSHTHLLITSDNIKYGIQSPSYNFDEFGGKVEIQGTIVSIEKILPIVQVSNIKVIQSDMFSFDIKKDFSTLLVNKGLYIIFADSSSTIAQTQSWIDIKNTAQKTLASIEIFDCQLAIAEKNCKKLIQSYVQSGYENFSSSNGDVYYRLPNQNIWFISSSDQKQWYRFNVQDEKTMITLSQSFQFLNKDFFIRLISNDISKICFDRSDSMQTLDKLDLKYVDKKFTARLVGKDLNQSVVACNIAINESPKGFDVRMTSFQWADLTNTQDIVNTTQAPDMNNVLVYQARGYQIIFPSKDIIFQTFFSQEDFGILWLNCDRKINVIAGKNKKLADENPQYIKLNSLIEIFICNAESSQGLQNISNDKLLYKTINDKHFFIRINNSDWKSFAQSITIQ